MDITSIDKYKFWNNEETFAERDFTIDGYLRNSFYELRQCLKSEGINLNQNEIIVAFDIFIRICLTTTVPTSENISELNVLIGPRGLFYDITKVSDEELKESYSMSIPELVKLYNSLVYTELKISDNGLKMISEHWRTAFMEFGYFFDDMIRSFASDVDQMLRNTMVFTAQNGRKYLNMRYSYSTTIIDDEVPGTFSISYFNNTKNLILIQVKSDIVCFKHDSCNNNIPVSLEYFGNRFNDSVSKIKNDNQ